MLRTANTDKVLAFIRELGYNPDLVEKVEITPTGVTVYSLEERPDGMEGVLVVDGDAVRRIDHLTLRRPVL